MEKGPSLVLLFLGVLVSLTFSSYGFSWCFEVFSAYLTGILRLAESEKSLMFLRGFPWFSKRPRKRRIGMGILFATPTPTYKAKKYEQKHGPQTAELALF